MVTRRFENGAQGRVQERYRDTILADYHHDTARPIHKALQRGGSAKSMKILCLCIEEKLVVTLLYYIDLINFFGVGRKKGRNLSTICNERSGNLKL